MKLGKTVISTWIMANGPVLHSTTPKGLVFLPGMMTGQILGGQSPSTAAAYQVMINFCICAARCTSVLILTALVLQRVFDIEHHALKSDSSIGLVINEAQTLTKGETNTTLSSPIYAISPIISPSTVNLESNGGGTTILSVSKLTIPKTNITVTFDVTEHDRIGVVGRSGIGKSQCLKAISKLTARDEGAEVITLTGADAAQISTNLWRSKVLWVSQDRPTLPGTPRDFLIEVLSYKSQKARGHVNTIENAVQLAEKWSLSHKAWEREWKTLSGGEAQRASLAIALSLQPDVLLLDEPTSACDFTTTLSIEEALRHHNKPFLIVSHDVSQIDRLCNNRLKLI